MLDISDTMMGFLRKEFARLDAKLDKIIDKGRMPATEAEKMRDQRESWPGMLAIDGVIVEDAEAELTGTPSKVGQRVIIKDRDDG